MRELGKHLPLFQMTQGELELETVLKISSMGTSVSLRISVVL